jgi:hypothetical protein
MPHDGLLRYARNDVEPAVVPLRRVHSNTGTRQKFFIIFIDRMFTTFIAPAFTNALDANGEIIINP